MRNIYKINQIFISVYIIFLVCTGVILLSFSKSDIHLWINKYHSGFFDVFFYIITALGDGRFLLIVVCILLFIKYRHAIILSVGYISSTLLVQLFKHIIFPDYYRPRKYLSHVDELYLIPWLDIHGYHSFPSGHTATAFCMFFCLSYLFKSKKLNLLFIILSLLVAYSRIYLSQHFLIDIYAGSVIGILMGYLSVYFMNKFKNINLDGSLLVMFASKYRSKQ